MTVVAGFSSQFDAVLVADTRLTGVDAAGKPIVYRDICQKAVMVNGWSGVAFAGNVCLARHLLGAMVSKLRSMSWEETPGWLRDDAAVQDFVAYGLEFHQRETGHDSWLEDVHLMIAFVDHTRSIVEGDHKPGDELFVPGTELLVIETPAVTVRRTPFGIDVIGSGAIVTPHLRTEFLNVANMGGDEENNQRSFGLMFMIRTLLDRAGVDSTGGLYIPIALSRRGVQTVPYFYWRQVASGCGTYVAMRIENGNWVQEHRPTGTVVRVAPPGQIDLSGGWVPGKHEMFDPAVTLTPDSPGVIPSSNPQMLFSPYDPGQVPPDIIGSWGPDRLVPLTYSASLSPNPTQSP